MRLQARDQRIPLSIQFEQAALLGRTQARQSSQSSRWEGRLRDHTTASPAVASRGTGTQQASKDRADRGRRELSSRSVVKVAPGKAGQKLADEKPTRKSGRGTTAKAEAEKKKEPVIAHTAVRRRGWKSVRTRQASKESSVEVELVAELPAMADEELGAYAEVENAEMDAPTASDAAQETGRRRRMSNKAERYGQKPETSPKTPNGSKGGPMGDKSTVNGDRNSGEGPRGSVEHAAMVVSPGTAVKRSPGERGHEGTAPGVTSPGSLKALKATFEMGVRAELEARRTETERAIEADREKMKTHEVALRKRVREREEAEADRDQAVLEVEEYVATKQRAAEELERRAKRARTEAEEAEKETEAARQRASEEYARRVEGLDVEEEQRAIEALQSAIAAREKALRDGERKEAEAVGALVNEQLTELQQKVDKIWGQQVAGARNGA